MRREKNSDQREITLEFSDSRESKICTDLTDLEEYLQRLIARARGCVYIEIGTPVRHFLQVGVENDAAFAAYTPLELEGLPDRLQWNLWARKRAREKSDGFVEFAIGGTPTKIAEWLCISISEILKIARYYYQTGALLDSVEWEEDREDWPTWEDE